MVDHFHHVKFHVSNALQSSYWYCCNFGFKRFAIRRTSDVSEVAIRNGKIILVFKCALTPHSSLAENIGKELARHGDFVKDVAYLIDDLKGFISKADTEGLIGILNGVIALHPNSLKASKQPSLKVISEISTVSDDNGAVLMATIRGSAGNIVHTLVENIDYGQPFLPGFQPIDDFSLSQSLRPIPLIDIDHVVEGHPENATDDVIAWYENTLHLMRFWTLDDMNVCQTENSGLRAAFIANEEKSAKVVLVEPVRGRTRGQIQEYLDYNGGPGVQHIAFLVEDIVSVVECLKERGVDFISIPDTYYKLLRLRLDNSDLEVKEDLDAIQRLGILLDFDEKGYLLQIFTRPMQDRSTFFVEIIQRHHFEGFGAGNLKALFAAVEMDRRSRKIPE